MGVLMRARKISDGINTHWVAPSFDQFMTYHDPPVSYGNYDRFAVISDDVNVMAGPGANRSQEVEEWIIASVDYFELSFPCALDDSGDPVLRLVHEGGDEMQIGTHYNVNTGLDPNRVEWISTQVPLDTGERYMVYYSADRTGG